jgi:hypothetical protein
VAQAWRKRAQCGARRAGYSKGMGGVLGSNGQNLVAGRQGVAWETPRAALLVLRVGVPVGSVATAPTVGHWRASRASGPRNSEPLAHPRRQAGTWRGGGRRHEHCRTQPPGARRRSLVSRVGMGWRISPVRCTKARGRGLKSTSTIGGRYATRDGGSRDTTRPQAWLWCRRQPEDAVRSRWRRRVLKAQRTCQHARHEHSLVELSGRYVQRRTDDNCCVWASANGLLIVRSPVWWIAGKVTCHNRVRDQEDLGDEWRRPDLQWTVAGKLAPAFSGRRSERSGWDGAGCGEHGRRGAHTRHRPAAMALQVAEHRPHREDDLVAGDSSRHVLNADTEDSSTGGRHD